MSEWRDVALGEVIHVKHGFAFKGEYFAESGSEIVLTPGNFRIGGGLQLTLGDAKYYDGPYPEEFRLRPGDLLVVMTDLKQDAPILGSPAVVPPDGVFLHNQRLGLVTVTAPDRLDNRFLYWLLAADRSRAQLRATATGATVRHTAPERIYKVAARLPDLATQRGIAAVLDSIDDLIENNRRRIVLLEQMAQAIYREWFVHFRYPGHEADELVDSPLGPIPNRFEVMQLGAFCGINRQQRRPDPDEEIVYIDISTIGDRILNLPEPILGSNAPGRARRVLADRDIVWSMVRPGRRAHALVLKPKSNWIGSTGLAVISPNGIPSSFVFESVSSRTFSGYLVSKEQGAAYPAVRPVDFEEAEVVVPSSEILRLFDDAVAPSHNLIWELAAQGRAASELRDVLLPKLVTGAIDVSKLDLDALLEESAA